MVLVVSGVREAQAQSAQGWAGQGKERSLRRQGQIDAGLQHSGPRVDTHSLPPRPETRGPRVDTVPRPRAPPRNQQIEGGHRPMALCPAQKPADRGWTPSHVPAPRPETRGPRVDTVPRPRAPPRNQQKDILGKGRGHSTIPSYRFSRKKWEHVLFCAAINTLSSVLSGMFI